MTDFEKLGVFYLGREVADGADGDLLLYDARDLTTHAVIVGMTGSGKTGLGVALLEEAAIDGVPAIVVDPKGDMGNLLLSFPELRPADFRPWIDESEAARHGLAPEEAAARAAQFWRDGLARWGQDGARIRRFREAAEVGLYTPGNVSVRPLQVMSSLAPADAGSDPAATRDRIQSTVSGLLGLLGIEADPVQSREHILLSTLLDRAWSEGRHLDLPTLIREVQAPPIASVGVFDIESFFPARDRLALAMRLNNLIASPGFSAWMQGEPLDVRRLLYTADGRPRVSILSIAHLSDAERMFFVTLLLGEVLAWTRAQAGTSSLRAILYMDEIFGFFPPTANPPPKTPMLTLLKQARAYGLGVVLATQNPVDLDYKGLSNAGTWFIGRLQTARDKDRVIEGIESAPPAPGGGLDRLELDRRLSNLRSRIFLMRNVHRDAPVAFETRWTLSYLSGPMTLAQLRALSAPPSPSAVPAAPAAARRTPAPPPAEPSTMRPSLPPGTPEFFLRPGREMAGWSYRPMAGVVAKLHFVDARAGVDVWLPAVYVAPLDDDGRRVIWDQGRAVEGAAAAVETAPRPAAAFEPLPGAPGPAAIAEWKREAAGHLYQTATLDLFAAPSVKLVSSPGETRGEFTVRLGQALRERRDEALAAMRAKHAARLRMLQDRVARAEDRREREKAQAGQQSIHAAISLGATVLGALFGRRATSVGTVGRAATTLRSASRIRKEREDAARAAENLATAQRQLADLEAQIERDIADLQAAYDPSAIRVETIRIRPRKADITIGQTGLAWTPWATDPDGAPEMLA